MVQGWGGQGRAGAVMRVPVLNKGACEAGQG